MQGNRCLVGDRVGEVALGELACSKVLASMERTGILLYALGSREFISIQLVNVAARSRYSKPLNQLDFCIIHPYAQRVNTFYGLI